MGQSRNAQTYAPGVKADNVNGLSDRLHRNPSSRPLRDLQSLDDINNRMHSQNAQFVCAQPQTPRSIVNRMLSMPHIGKIVNRGSTHELPHSQSTQFACRLPTMPSTVYRMFGVDSRPAVKRAVVVGVNYTHLVDASLAGSVNDATAFAITLVNYFGFDPRNIMLLIDDVPAQCYWHNAHIPPTVDPDRLPTRHNILMGVQWLCNGTIAGDVLVFYFAGHGVQVDNMSGWEGEGYDEAILPADHNSGAEVNALRAITLRELLLSVGKDVHVSVVLDCNGGQTMLDPAGTGGWRYIKGVKTKGLWPFITDPTNKVERACYQSSIWRNKAMRARDTRPRFLPGCEVSNTQGLADPYLEKPRLEALHGGTKGYMLAAAPWSQCAVEARLPAIVFEVDVPGGDSTSLNPIAKSVEVNHGVFTWALISGVLQAHRRSSPIASGRPQCVISYRRLIKDIQKFVVFCKSSYGLVKLDQIPELTFFAAGPAEASDNAFLSNLELKKATTGTPTSRTPAHGDEPLLPHHAMYLTPTAAEREMHLLNLQRQESDMSFAQDQLRGEAAASNYPLSSVRQILPDHDKHQPPSSRHHKPKRSISAAFSEGVATPVGEGTVGVTEKTMTPIGSGRSTLPPLDHMGVIGGSVTSNEVQSARLEGDRTQQPNGWKGGDMGPSVYRVSSVASLATSCGSQRRQELVGAATTRWHDVFEPRVQTTAALAKSTNEQLNMFILERLFKKSGESIILDRQEVKQYPTAVVPQTSNQDGGLLPRSVGKTYQINRENAAQSAQTANLSQPTSGRRIGEINTERCLPASEATHTTVDPATTARPHKSRLDKQVESSDKPQRLNRSGAEKLPRTELNAGDRVVLSRGSHSVSKPLRNTQLGADAHEPGSAYGCRRPRLQPVPSQTTRTTRDSHLWRSVVKSCTRNLNGAKDPAERRSFVWDQTVPCVGQLLAAKKTKGPIGAIHQTTPSDAVKSERHMDHSSPVIHKNTSKLKGRTNDRDGTSPAVVLPPDVVGKKHKANRKSVDTVRHSPTMTKNVTRLSTKLPTEKPTGTDRRQVFQYITSHHLVSTKDRKKVDRDSKSRPQPVTVSVTKQKDMACSKPVLAVCNSEPHRRSNAPMRKVSTRRKESTIKVNPAKSVLQQNPGQNSLCFSGGHTAHVEPRATSRGFKYLTSRNQVSSFASTEISQLSTADTCRYGCPTLPRV